MLRLPASVLAETIRMMADCGKGQCECVTYWTGLVGGNGTVDGWDHPTHRRSPYGYQIDDAWLTRYWFQLARQGRAIRAQVHTHPGLAFHSETDDHWPVISQPGFISIVIPDFAMGPIDLNKMWAGILTVDGVWREAPITSVLEIIL